MKRNSCIVKIVLGMMVLLWPVIASLPRANGADRQTGAIGDLVWYDENGNRTPDEAADHGLNNVVLNLYNDAACDGVINGADQIVQSVTTQNAPSNNNPGWYQFTALAAGCYIVNVDESTLPPNMVMTTATEPYPVRLTDGQVVSTVDFGYDDSGAIGNFVWYDANGDGFPDTLEVGINNVTVKLYSDTDCSHLPNPNDTLLATTVSLSAPDPGFYQFRGLAPGCYLVDVDTSTLPPNLVRTSVSAPYPVLLGSGESYVNADFGYLGNGSPTSVPSASPTFTPIPTQSPTPIPTHSPTPRPTSTTTRTPIATASPTPAPIPALGGTGILALLFMLSLLLITRRRRLFSLRRE